MLERGRIVLILFWLWLIQHSVMFLIDTNVVSETLRRMPDAAVIHWLSGAQNAAISVISVEEIVFGLTRVEKPGLLPRFETFLLRVQVLDVTALIARRAAQLRGGLGARGMVRSQADMLIAATAQAHALTLVTRNVRDFEGCGIPLLNPFTS